MVVLPKDFVATRFAGYFWNTAERKLYSIKVHGELRPLPLQKGGCWFGREIPDGYRVSVNGNRRYLGVDYLNKLHPVDTLQEIGVRK